jgi:hypothetical protein
LAEEGGVKMSEERSITMSLETGRSLLNYGQVVKGVGRWRDRLERKL